MQVKKKVEIAKQIVKDCFWDLNIGYEDILKIVEKNNFREKQKLFEKIIYNSTDRILALKLFNEHDIRELFLDFKVNNQYRKKKILQRIEILKSIFLKEEVSILSWEWKHRDL